MEDNNERNDDPEVAPEENDNNDNQADEADEDENENEGDGGNNNNLMIDIDLEEDEEDGDNDSTYDGGVAVNAESNSGDAPSKGKKHSSDCDLVSSTTVMRRI
jgi:hypothetical protein